MPIPVKFRKNYPFKNLTTLNIGGPIKLFIAVKSEKQFINTIKYAYKNQLNYLIIGGGSNLLVSDIGFDGLVIKNEVVGIKDQQDFLIVKSGTPFQQLVDYTVSRGLDGMSAMTGIPGTVGGAVYGSAGAYGDNIRDYLYQIKIFDGSNIKVFSKENYGTGYRDSIFKHNKNLTILEITFSKLPKADKNQLVEHCRQILNKRCKKYPANTKCPGSFYKNVPLETISKEALKLIPKDKIKFNKIPAGYLLEAVGAKGNQFKNIKISSKHGNTFINLGDGTAKDFYSLAKKYALRVYKKFGIKLEPEVQLINLPPLFK